MAWGMDWLGVSLSTKLTVARDNPVACATSVLVTLRAGFFPDTPAPLFSFVTRHAIAGTRQRCYRPRIQDLYVLVQSRSRFIPATPPRARLPIPPQPLPAVETI
ncbi:hypothetical protein GCM10023075_78900 [Streptosporangium album]